MEHAGFQIDLRHLPEPKGDGLMCLTQNGIGD